MSRRFTWRPHWHRVVGVHRGLVVLDGQGETTDLQMCRCLAWRQAGRPLWHGSMFRTIRGVNR